MGLFDFLKPKSPKEKAIKRYYSNYPEIPYISDERDFSTWLDRVYSNQAKNLVSRSMMVRYEDGLLPGHVYMLHWLTNTKSKKIPAYFEYEYGIDFEAEKQFLIENGYLGEASKLTEKGELAMKEHYDVIEQRLPKPKQEKVVESSPTGRRAIPASKIDEMQRIEASEGYKNKIYKKYYPDYPEKPFISKDREKNTNWPEQADMFPKQCIIPKSMMTRFNDGLLPGHIYMLYWLKKYTNKRVPSYFEYKYGVNFEKEKLYLITNGYLDNTLKPTSKGEEAIKKYHDIIDNHSSKPDHSIEGITKQILASKDNIVKNGFKEYTFHANSGCCKTCATLNGKHFPISKFKIGVNAPPMHDGCRCSISAYNDDSDYEAWLNHLAKGGTTKEWNKRKR